MLIPIFIVLVYSFLSKGTYGNIIFDFSFANYKRASDLLYFRIFWNSIKLATLTTVSCLIIGYPMAYTLATAPAKFRHTLLILVIIPFWTNLVLRAYAIKFLLTRQFGMSEGDLAVWLGMVTNYLPFMVIPLYVALEKFDFSLLEAARDLGASSVQSFRRVLLPLTKKAVITGCILVFIPALGEFVIPELLGGARTMLIGNLIAEQFLKARDWPFGSALSILLIAPVFFVLLLNPKAEEVA